MSREARENTALALAERGEPHTVIAARLGVSAPTVSKLIKAARARGDVRRDRGVDGRRA